MESRPTILLAIILVLGGAFVAVLDRAGPVAPEQAAASAKPQELPALRLAASGCGAVPRPLAPLCEKFEEAALEPPTPPRAVRSGEPPRTESPVWENAPWLKMARGKTRFLIVTVPDPELTRLSLYFDRSMDSIQRAAESVEFYLDRHWLPWTEDAAGGGANAGGDEPGVLLFRESGAGQGVLVVFLVGESPVSGIRGRAFLKAVQYVQAVAAPETFFVSGTNYSGALSSLRRGIADARRLFLQGSAAKFQVISGSATVKSEMDAFANGDLAWEKSVSFASAMHNDTFAKERFLSYMRRRWLGPIPSAFLAEGQTAYGIDSLAGPQAMLQAQASLTIRFPREIARLRGASPQPAAAKRDGGAISGGAANSQLSVPVQQVLKGRDAVAIFSGPQLPVVQEAVLLDIASTLQHEDIRLAGIAATDVFDALFLAGFLRKANPDVRLYMDDADLLYVRAVSQYPLEGILAITTYPVVTHNQLWSPGVAADQWPQRSPTGSRYEVAVFNAVRALLLRQAHGRSVAPASPISGAAIAESPSPVRWPSLLEHSFAGRNFKTRPPLWLVAVGVNGYWPIALLNPSETDETQLSWQPGLSAARNPVLDLGRPGRPWTVVFLLLVCIGGLFGCLTIVAQLPVCASFMERILPGFKAIRERPFWRQFLVHSLERGAPGRAYFVSAQCLALAAMLYPVACPLWLLALESPSPAVGVPYVSPGDWARLACIPSLFAFLALMAGAILPFLRLFLDHASQGTLPEGEGPMLSNQYIHLAVVTFLVYPGPMVLYWLGLAGHDDQSLFFFVYRSLNLLNGVSPATPLLLLGCGLIVMARLHARRHALSLEAPMVLPELPEDFQTKGLRKGVEAVGQSLANPITSDPGATLLILLPALAIFFLIPWEWPQSLEGWQYDVVYQITLRALFVFAVISWSRFVLAWMKLRGLLEILDLHPLRAAFSILPSGYSQVPVLEGSGTLDSRDRLVYLGQRLRALAACPRVAKLDFLAPAALRSLEGRIEAAIGREPQFLASVWSSVAKIGSVLAGFLEPVWSTGYGTAEDVTKPKGDSPPDRRPYQIAEEIVALPYLAFLGNAMLQLRNLLFYVAVSYFLGMVSALVYPFRGLQMIIWAGTVGFVVMGIPVAVAIFQMERDEILRRLTRGKEDPGAFRLVKRLAMVGGLPILAMVGSYFPGIGRYLMTVVEPALKAL
ncbi:MAG: hypothetical protein IT170_00975 [Bryobacterales bacterium]|nr:hypothetical protein [Bryobacterales bacterium]